MGDGGRNFSSAFTAGRVLKIIGLHVFILYVEKYCAISFYFACIYGKRNGARDGNSIRGNRQLFFLFLKKAKGQDGFFSRGKHRQCSIFFEMGTERCFLGSSSFLVSQTGLVRRRRKRNVSPNKIGETDIFPFSSFFSAWEVGGRQPRKIRKKKSLAQSSRRFVRPRHGRFPFGLLLLSFSRGKNCFSQTAKRPGNRKSDRHHAAFTCSKIKRFHLLALAPKIPWWEIWLIQFTMPPTFQVGRLILINWFFHFFPHMRRCGKRREGG